LLIILTMIGLSGIYADFLLSFNAYQNDPARFIAHEASREAVHFFTDGIIPPIFVISIVGLPIILYYAVKWHEEHKTFKFKKEYTYILTLFVYFLFATRLSAGLTWYHISFTLIVPIVQIFAFMCLGGVVVFMYLMYKEDRYEFKNTNQTYN